MVYNDRVRTPRDKEEDHPAEKKIYSEMAMAEENEWGGYKFDLLPLAGRGLMMMIAVLLWLRTPREKDEVKCMDWTVVHVGGHYYCFV